MAFAALLSACKSSTDSSGALRGNLHFAGQTLVEYQARQAARAGAAQVLIRVSAVTPALSQAVDRLSADGISVSLIRDMVTLVRDAPRDRDMMVIADGMIVAQTYIEAMAQSKGNALLVADDSRATAAFERIDAGQRWAGLARITPDLLFGTLDMIGEWDLELTLVRAAVQAGARRATVTQDDVLEGRVALVEGQRHAELVAHAVIAGEPQAAGRGGGFEHYALAPVARMIAPVLLRSQMPAMQVRVAAIAMAAIAMVPIELTWGATGLLMLIVALMLGLTADRLDMLTLRPRNDGWTAMATPVMAAAGMALADGGWGGVQLALLLGVILIADRLGRTGAARPWMIFTPGSALIFLLLASLLDSLARGVMVAIMAATLSLGAMLLRRPAA